MNESERLQVWQSLMIEAMRLQCEMLKEINQHLAIIRVLTEQENDPEQYEAGEPDPFQTLNGPRL